MELLKFIIQIAEKLTLALLKVTFAMLGMLARTLGDGIAHVWRQRQQKQPQGGRRSQGPQQYGTPRRYRRRVRRRA